jgi:hypothetical protein
MFIQCLDARALDITMQGLDATSRSQNSQADKIFKAIFWCLNFATSYEEMNDKEIKN